MKRSILRLHKKIQIQHIKMLYINPKRLKGIYRDAEEKVQSHYTDQSRTQSEAQADGRREERERERERGKKTRRKAQRQIDVMTCPLGLTELVVNRQYCFTTIHCRHTRTATALHDPASQTHRTTT